MPFEAKPRLSCSHSDSIQALRLQCISTKEEMTKARHNNPNSTFSHGAPQGMQDSAPIALKDILAHQLEQKHGFLARNSISSNRFDRRSFR